MRADRDRLTVRSRWGPVHVADDSPLVREALHRMSLGPVSLEHIPVLSAELDRWRADGSCGPQWSRLKRTLDQLGGCVIPSLGLHNGAGPILSLVAVTADAWFDWPDIADTEAVHLARGAAITDPGGGLVLGAPGARYAVHLHRPPATGIAKLLGAGENTVVGLAERLRVDRAVVADVVAYLASADLVLRGRDRAADHG